MGLLFYCQLFPEMGRIALSNKLFPSSTLSSRGQGEVIKPNARQKPGVQYYKVQQYIFYRLLYPISHTMRLLLRGAMKGCRV